MAQVSMLESCAGALREVLAAAPREANGSYVEVHTTECHAGSDGDCSWSGCPQTRDGEPGATGRHCPLDAIAVKPWAAPREASEPLSRCPKCAADPGEEHDDFCPLGPGRWTAPREASEPQDWYDRDAEHYARTRKASEPDD